MCTLILEEYIQYFPNMMFPHLLLLWRSAAQQHVEQNVRQQVDRDFVVVFDDESAAGEHFAGQLVSHL